MGVGGGGGLGRTGGRGRRLPCLLLGSARGEQPAPPCRFGCGPPQAALAHAVRGLSWLLFPRCRPWQVAKTRVRVREMKAALSVMQALHRGEGCVWL